MQPSPSFAPRLLSTWERGLEFNDQPVRRALLLLEIACPQLSVDERERMPLGRRDAQLMTLREQTFGPTLVSVVPCPRCAEQQELVFNTSDIRTPVPGSSAGVEAFALEAHGYRVAYRLPNSGDLLAVADAYKSGAGSPLEQAETEVAEIERALLGRCLIQAWHNGAEIACDALPTTVLAGVEAQMSEDDPQADVQLALECSDCGHEWSALLDITTFLWSELASWATRMLREIHVLARSYGWSEADILSMHPIRRDFYLQLLEE